MLYITKLKLLHCSCNERAAGRDPVRQSNETINHIIICNDLWQILSHK